jgi:hypothetical protein
MTEVTTDEKPVSMLYAAATESLVSEASATSTFEKMIAVAYTHATVETFSEELNVTEKQIQSEFEITSMPGPWRSAKSVIRNAMRFKIPLIDANGNYRGKTALQTDIKALKVEKDPMTNNEYADSIIKKLMNVPEGCDSRTVAALVRDFLKVVV